MSGKKIEIVCCLGLGNSQVYNHLLPIAEHPMVSKVWIVRSSKDEVREIPSCEYIIVPEVWKPLRWLKMLRHCRRLAARPEVRAFVSFNPFPYGLISALAAKSAGKPVHFGFIGSDWYRDAKGKMGLFFRKLINGGAFFTVTGERMLKDLVDHGFDRSKIALLPHSVDLSVYPVADVDVADYAAVFVGKLSKLKRVDTIITAFSEVIGKHPDARLCIVGEGTLGLELKGLAHSLGIEKAIDFVGYQKDVYPFISRSKMSVIASSSEGFPFSLVEAICSGVVPVSTPVGTIADEIKDGENGLLFPCGDSDALATCINRLLDEPETYKRIRNNVIAMRERYSFDEATKVWDSFFTDLLGSE